ncbi:MAG TPA: pyrroline-5-carboxylate reductase dimerization domain-containing protein [Methanomassiliicoccales archaeon]|nr:pyrroline-5-carboxylate reductase dimerization domain-containing protein [Methanomassiliicoccales archaeon]
MRYGFIGLGNMGSSLAAGLLDSGAVSPGFTVVANRSLAKAQSFARRYPGVTVAESNLIAAEGSDTLFVAVRTDQLLGVLKEVSSAGKHAHVVVVNGAIPLPLLEKVCRSPVSRLIPSVTMERGRGVSLLSHGPSVSAPQARRLQEALGRASMVIAVQEDKMDAAADLTSCGPALIAETMRQFAEAGVRRGLDPNQAWEMVLETMQGAALALTSGESVASLKEKVATRGGITEQGLLVLEAELPAVFDKVMDRTLAKHAEVRERLMKDIGQ